MPANKITAWLEHDFNRKRIAFAGHSLLRVLYPPEPIGWLAISLGGKDLQMQRQSIIIPKKGERRRMRSEKLWNSKDVDERRQNENHQRF